MTEILLLRRKTQTQTNEQYFKVYAILSQLKYSFDDVKVVSVTGIWNNVKEERNVPPECQKCREGHCTLEHQKQQTKNLFINSKAQVIRIWNTITWGKQATN